jgi:hypothetical protein
VTSSSLLPAGLAVVLCLAATACGEPFAYVGGGGTGGALTTNGGSNTTGSGGDVTTSSTDSSGSTTATTSTSSTSSSTGGAKGTPCDPMAGNTCAAGLHCMTADCLTGTCQAVPGPKGQKYEIVCGCDGVAYWNAEIAIHDGIAYRTVGCLPNVLKACTLDGKECDHNKNHFCDRDATLQAAACMAPDSVNGACMRLPDDCAGTDRTGVECPAMNQCSRVCDLIRNEVVFRVNGCTP